MAQDLSKLFKNVDRSYGLIFDLDGTLVDTSKSFDETIKYLVLKYAHYQLPDAELSALREEGGFNDDWVACRELLRRHGVERTFEDVAKEATDIYLELAPKTETALFDPKLIEQLRKRHPISIVTGRNRIEYGPWASRLDPMFDKIYCLLDLPGKRPKPAPDYLLQVIADFNLSGGVYIGNAVDDMWSARDAGLSSIGITTTLSREALEQAGANLVIESVNDLEKVFEVNLSV
jgi:histidinol-phosphate aminotransferase